MCQFSLNLGASKSWNLQDLSGLWWDCFLALLIISRISLFHPSRPLQLMARIHHWTRSVSSETLLWRAMSITTMFVTMYYLPYNSKTPNLRMSIICEYSVAVWTSSIYFLYLLLTKWTRYSLLQNVCYLTVRNVSSNSEHLPVYCNFPFESRALSFVFKA